MSAHEGAECRPPEGAEEGSLHWLTEPTGRTFILRWDRRASGFWLESGGGGEWINLKRASKFGWRYLHPASPHDATELAQVTSWYNTIAPKYDALREEYKKSQNRIAEMEAALETIGRLLAGQNGAVAASLAAIVSAALQRARKEG